MVLLLLWTSWEHNTRHSSVSGLSCSTYAKKLHAHCCYSWTSLISWLCNIPSSGCCPVYWPHCTTGSHQWPWRVMHKAAVYISPGACAHALLWGYNQAWKVVQADNAKLFSKLVSPASTPTSSVWVSEAPYLIKKTHGILVFLISAFW